MKNSGRYLVPLRRYGAAIAAAMCSSASLLLPLFAMAI
jgi:hypothetical protein